MEQMVIDPEGRITTKKQKTIERIKMFEPPEGYYLAFSGGKDSIVTYHMLKEAGVKFDSHYNWTTVDPPELVYFIKEHYPDVVFEKPKRTMWQLIVDKGMPPTRLARYCCQELKEGGGEGRFVATGVRWAESIKRRGRSEVEFDAYGGKSKKAIADREIFLNSDNDDKRRMIENCQKKSKHILNPIVDWEDWEVWEYIKGNNIPYPSLYDEGFRRLGCILCPMATPKEKKKMEARWPKYKQNYIKAFARMLERRKEKGKDDSGGKWGNSAKEVYRWWVSY